MALTVEEFRKKREDARNAASSNSAINEFRKKRGTLGVANKDLKTSEGLYKFAESQGVKPPEESKPLSALRRAGGILNTGTAFSSGLLKGALTPGESALGEAFSSVKKSFTGEEITGFSDTARSLGVNPTSRWGKVGLATGGFIADVLFDFMTYLSFGTSVGLKIGVKTLDSAGTKLFQEVATEATKTAGNKGIRKAELLFEEALGKKGITEESIPRLVSEGWDEPTLRRVAQEAPTMIDRGGIKFAGNTLIGSDAIAKSPIGKIAKVISETELVKNFTEAFGKTFVADFAKNPKIVSIIDKGGIQIKKAVDGIIETNKALFKGLSDEQMARLFTGIWDQKMKVAKAGKEAIALGKEAGLKGKKLLATETEARMGAKELQRGEKLVFDDPVLQEVSDKLFEKGTMTDATGKVIETKPIVARWAELAGIPEEEAIKFYIPSKFKEFLDKREEFIRQSGVSSPNKDFLKKFTGSERADQIKDPFELFTRGQIEVATARIKSETARAVAKELGIPLQELTEQEAKRLGYVKFERDVLGQEVKAWIPKQVSEEINKFFQPKLSPIDQLAKASGFDYATAIFKGFVTSIFPAFHVRNITSNQFQNMLKIGVDVLNPNLQKDALSIVLGKNLDKVLTTKTGRQITLRQIKEMVEKESDILGTGAFGTVDQFIDEARIGRDSLAQKLNPLSRDNVALQAGRKFGSKAEAQAKLVNILSNVMQGKTIKEGVKSAEEALFNYSKLTEFERSVMRRVIPFYTFARKNLELQLKTLATNPGMVASELKAIRSVGEAVGEPVTEEDIKGLPDYVLSSLGIKAGTDKYGRPNFVTGFGLPIEEFFARMSGDKGILANAASNVLSQTNPILKFIGERATGQDFFRGRPITEISNGKDLLPFFAAMPKPVADKMKEMLEFKEIPKQPVYVNGKVVGYESKYSANPFALHFMRNLFTARIQSTVGFLSAEDETNFNKLLKFFTGVKSWSIDQEQQKFYNERERSKELQDFLLRMGLLKKFESVYKPKEKATYDTEDGTLEGE